MIAHIVLFSPKPSLTDEERRSFARTVVDVCSSIPSVKRFSVGKAVDVDPGYQRSMGDTTYKYAAILEFAGESELKAYLTDRRHEELGRLFWLSCERTVVSEVQLVDPSDADVIDKLVS